MHDLPHLAARLYGAPLLVARSKLDVILAALGPRLAGQAAPFDGDAIPSDDVEVTPDGIAIIPVVGTLVARSGYLGAASGLTAYSDIAETIEAAATDPGIRAILLDVDSSGGEVGGLFDLVDHIQAIRSQCGKPIWAVADEAALSAAYAIACTADRLYVTQTGEVGSIGVVAVHRDESGADAQAGLAWTFVHAGAAKVDGNPHQPLSDSARAALQADVDALYGKFATLVAERRRLSPDAVRATEAVVYRGDQAVAAGLADKVGTLRQALADLGASLTRPSVRTPVLSRPKETTMSEQTGDIPINETERSTPGAIVPVPGAITAQVEQRLRAEYSEISAIAAQAARLGVTIDPAEAMAKGIRPEALRRTVLEQLAERSEATDVVAAAPAGAAPKSETESPIVRRAREAAARK
ncbi:S49 family peptidase [Paramagnetospirillum magneticum]|uniref:Periplasmic serine protease n=1 Tax=Paramagnetospirillum magneticum (strain ATCC 700264 / AMB-1) TaxID=342108 RepID=Q2WAE6_PARM1|nr:S49 family peptidase [Paramagnetospirillum magneticum]BAE49179.1 Periplasmic serine protease [Paramagnetospirillum magneticum AMB-1]